MGTLYLVPTPLGNLEDITLRTLRILREVSLIATEDTRTTGRLLKHFDINGSLLSYHQHSAETRLARVLEALREGDVALVSEAGTPLLSDPGYKLVRAVIETGFAVVALPGPSAVTTALSVSGLPTDRFLFAGFLPRKSSDRRRVLKELAGQTATLIFFESPHRLQTTLKDMVDVLGAERAVAVCRELTKLHEEVWRGTLAGALKEWVEREPRGEFTLVVAGAGPSSDGWNEIRVEAALTDALATGMTPKDAVRHVTNQSGWPKREVYALAQKLK
jgi:16S rRNA (cytidine1402-2'-O)-methyltransferase